MADIAAREPRFGPYLDQDNIIWLGYKQNDREHCPPGWLVNNMAFGVGDPSTIMTETLSSGKPYFARYTVTIDTPLRRRLVEDGFLTESSDIFEATLKTALNDIKNVRQPDDIYKTWFDPFQDDDAMGRMASVIYQDPGVPTQSDSA